MMIDWLCWASISASSEQADLSLLDDLGGCFETLVEALAAARNSVEKSQGTEGHRTTVAAHFRSAIAL